MKARVLSVWESIHTSFWFFPALMALAAIALSYAIVETDRVADVEIERSGRLGFPGGADGARAVLSTIAGSVITVAGVVFSITIAALTMAGQQFGPRLLRNFMADKGNQLVLGTFVGTFIYSLLVLRTIEGSNGDSFIPEIAVTTGIALALVSFGVLIYFFHHSSTSIQAEQVVDTIFRELIREIDKTFPEKEKEEQANERLAPEGHPRTSHPGGRAVTVVSEANGYLRAIDIKGLLALATRHDMVISLRYRPGNFVFEQTPLAVMESEKDIDDDVHKQVRRRCVLGTYRSLEQDVEFPVQQLVDMALRALSPSLNDPYTAVNCIDRLGAALCHLHSRQPAPAYRHDENGNLRLVLNVHTYEGMVDAAFNQIRQSARRDAAVSIRLLETLQAMAVTAQSDHHRKVVRHHAEMIHRTAQEALTEQRDRDDLEQRFQAVMRHLDAGRNG
jgi:uncharacterized membrane protein